MDDKRQAALASFALRVPVPNNRAVTIPLAPVIVTPPLRGVFCFLGSEIREECGVWADGDDGAVVLPDAVEERGEELAALVGVGLEFPEAGEVLQEFGGLVEAWVGG